jgi:hypothetical protein
MFCNNYTRLYYKKQRLKNKNNNKDYFKDKDKETLSLYFNKLKD